MKENTLLIEKFFTKKECKDIIEKYAKNLPKMTVLGSDNKNNYRIAEGTWVPKDSNNTVIEKFKNKVSEITGLPKEHQELPHLVRYVVGGEYKSHQDFFWPGTSYYDESMKSGGNRMFSCLLYLNDDFEGGQTNFPTWKLTVTPQTGSIISWRNMKENGELEKDSLHAGLPVTKGVKYILIIWVRERATN